MLKNRIASLLVKVFHLDKSRFVEMFFNKDFHKEPLKNNIIEMFIGPFGSALKNECFVSETDGDCMVYEQKHAIQKTMDLETRYVNKSKHDELKRFEVKPSDLIVSCRGTIGEIYEIPENAPIGIMHPSIMKIRLNKEKYNPTFFVHLLNKYMQEHLHSSNGSSVQMAIKASDLEKEQFILPSLDEQNRFVQFTHQLDKLKFESYIKFIHY